MTKASDLLTREEIRDLTTASNLAGFSAVATTWGAIALVFAGLAAWPHPATFAAAVIVLGGRQLALAVLMHEAAHGTLFRTRWLNDVLADWTCGRPVATDVARYRVHHLGHHAHAGTELDPDRSLVEPFPVTRFSLARKLARDVLGVSGLKRLVGLALMDLEVIDYTVAGDMRWLPWRGLAAHLAALVRNSAGAVLTNAALAALLSLVAPWLYLAWAAAYLTTFSLFLRVRSLAEHACLEASRDPLRNTRTTRAGLLARLTVAPHQVNFHLEHHLLMTVPQHRLGDLHRLLVARAAIPERSLAPSYGAVLRAAAGR